MVSAANTHDSRLFEPLLDAIPPVRRPDRRPGRPRRRPAKVHADKAYDHARCRAYLRRRGIGCRIARRQVERSDRLGRHRWKAERTIAWLLAYRRLQVRYDRHTDSIRAFLHLACALICLRFRPSTTRF